MLGCFQVPASATDADGDADAHTACPSSVSMRASHSASALRTSVYGKTPVLIGNRRRDDCDPGNSPLTFRKHSDRVSEDAKKICFEAPWTEKPGRLQSEELQGVGND